MTQSRSNPEDLSARARRGLLSEGEERTFERQLLANPSLQVAHAVGVDLDRSTAVRPGDEGLISRAADAALARVDRSGLAPIGPARRGAEPRSSGSPKRRRALAVLLSAALVLVTGVAAAFWSGVIPAKWLGRAGRSEATQVRESNGTHGRPSAVSHQATPTDIAPPREILAPAPAVEPGIDLSAKTRVDEVGLLAPRAPILRGPGESSATTLFRRANSARRGGDFEHARRAYTELIARYPSSDEARLARVSLGKLLLAKGNPSDAEHEFTQYLKGGPRQVAGQLAGQVAGQLEEEALVSRAQSLQKLGRADDERLTWQRLLAEYPNSVYAAGARGRLDALRRGTVSSP